MMRSLAATAVVLAAAVRWPVQTDIAAKAGITFRHNGSHTPEKYLVETMGSGVALIDFDGDGLLDVFFVNGAALPGADKSDPRYWNRLYRNRGGAVFVDVTEAAGVKGSGFGMGAAVADYDNDGRPDLYVTSFGRNLLYHNEGNGRFRDVTEESGAAGSGWSAGAAFLDYDRDGRLDLFVARYLDWDFTRNPWCGPQKAKLRGYCHPNVFPAVSHLLFHNEGNGRFRDVSAAAGIASHPGKGLGVAINDFDLDGWPDIAVANDSEAQQLFRNRHDGTFEEAGLESGIAFNSNGQSFAGMGIDSGDYDNDGRPDLFINALSLQGYVLFRNAAKGFDDESESTGITRISWNSSGWGVKFVDFDNDGWKDLMIAQGHVMDTIAYDFPRLSYREKMSMLRNTAGKFTDVTRQSGAPYALPLAARGAAFGDFDNDGCVDSVVVVNDGSPLLLRNQCAALGRHWIALRLEGAKSNRDGIGATVRITTAAGASQYAFVTTSSSYLSASDVRIHFGLGSEPAVRELEIRWPTGELQRLHGVKADRILTVKEPAD